MAWGGLWLEGPATCRAPGFMWCAWCRVPECVLAGLHCAGALSVVRSRGCATIGGTTVSHLGCM
eukprot:10363854-Alexandrium_andersonii.AAC.1